MSNEESDRPTNKKKHLLRGLLILAVIVVGVILGIEAILSKVLSDQLQKTGLQFKELKVTSVGLDGIETIEIKNLQFPASGNLSGISVESAVIEAGYDFSELIREKKLQKLKVKNLSISVNVDALSFKKSESEPVNFRKIPKLIFESLPETLPLDKLVIESGHIAVLNKKKLQFSIPFQLSFDATGKLKLQAPNFQFDTTYNRNMGHAIAKLQFQLKQVPETLLEMIPEEVPDVAAMNGLVLNSEISISNRQFKDASFFANITDLQSGIGTLKSTEFRMNFQKDLQLKNLIFQSHFSEVDTPQFSSESGMMNLSINRDLPSSFTFSTASGYLLEQYYRKIDFSAKVADDQCVSSGEITVLTGEVLPFKMDLVHPYVSQALDWFITPDGEFPILEKPDEFLKSASMEVGPVVLKESGLLNVVDKLFPEAYITGEISAKRIPGKSSTSVNFKDVSVRFPESGLKVSGLNSQITLSDPPDVLTVGTPEIEIGKIEFGDLLLENGILPFQVFKGEVPVIKTNGVTFDTMGGKMTVHPFAIGENGYDSLTYFKVSLEDLVVSEAQKFAGNLPLSTKGRLNGVVILKFQQRQISIQDLDLFVKPESVINVSIDAKEKLTKPYPKSSPEWGQMRRIEKILEDLTISELNVSTKSTKPAQLKLKAGHKSSKEDVGISIDLNLSPSSEDTDSLISVKGALHLYGEKIPYSSSLQHPFFSKLLTLLDQPGTPFPELPKPEELLNGLEWQVGPVKLTNSALLNKLQPDLPQMTVTGEFLATRTANNPDIKVNAQIDRLHAKEQNLTIFNLSTTPSFNLSPSFKTSSPAVLKIGEIQLQNWTLQNGEFPWQIFPGTEDRSSTLFTSGGNFDTLGGKISLGATAAELKGSRTMTTGRLMMENIDFEKITALTETPPLLLTGIFNGEIPFIYSSQDVDLQKGFLEMKSDSKGYLEYDAMGRFTNSHEPGSRSWKNMDMAERALRNLNISDIKLEFKPESDPNLPLRAYIKGSHESNSKKINLELTLNLRGDIKEILQQAATGKLELVP